MSDGSRHQMKSRPFVGLVSNHPYKKGIPDQLMQVGRKYRSDAAVGCRCVIAQKDGGLVTRLGKI